MIASINGEVTAIFAGSAVVEVSGIGYEVMATPSTLGGLHLGDTVRLFTALVVREDSLTLFGFPSNDERGLFTALQSVSGIGPRIALAVLAQFTPDLLRLAVEGEDVAAIKRVPGIGAKGAQRLILELRGKLGEAPAGAAGVAQTRAHHHAAAEEVVTALVGLGWPESIARDAVTAVISENGAPTEVGDILRLALRALGGPRG